jgi:ABC-2 type transport system permease protein
MKLNPVTMRELRERFRRKRAGVFVSIWIIVVTGVSYLIYLAARAWAASAGFFGGGSPLLISSSLGRSMFQMVSLLLLTGILLVVPGVASLSIVGERERLTLPLIQVSQLSPRQIILGKLASSLAYQVLLLVAVAPVLLVPMLFGGVGVGDVVAALASIGATAILVGGLSVWVSARAKSTRGAVAGSYLITFVLVLGTALLLIGEVVFFAPSDRDTWGPNGRELYSIWLNPYVAMVSAVDEPIETTNEFVFMSTPFDPIDTLLRYRQWGSRTDIGQTVFFTDAGPSVSFGAPGNSGAPMNRGRLWVRSLLVAVLLTVLGLWSAARKVTVPAPARLLPRRRRKERADAPT